MEVERITSLEELDKVINVWNELLFSSNQNCVFLTNEWFSSWWRSFSEDYSLEILIFKEKKGSAVGIAPLMLKDNSLYFIASQEVTDYCDFILHNQKRRNFFNKFLEYINANFPGMDKVELINIKHSSPTLKILPELASSYEYGYTSFENGVTPSIALPPSYDEYLSRLDNKNRHELRRKARRLESLEKIKTLRVTDTDELKAHTEDFIQFHQQSSPSKTEFWQKKGMADFFREIILRFSLRGWVELHILSCKDEIIAILLNFTYFDRVYFYNSAYNKEFARYSPGLFLFIQSLRQAIDEGKKEVNFLRGDERYKYSFGADEHSIFRILLNLRVS